MRIISYAQEYEDVILFALFKDLENDGFYIDVGANDPTEISVTKMFYDIGWRGINIEPLKSMYELLCVERKEDINLNIGISNHEGILEIVEDGVYSHFLDNDEKDKVDNKKMLCRVDTLTNVWKKYGNDKTCAFCKIDVEGHEKEVLEGIDFKVFKPRILVIESTEPRSLIDSYQKWEYNLLQNGYECGFHYGINRYYINKNDTIMKERMKNIGTYLSNYELVKVEYIHSKNFLNGLNFQKVKDRVIIFGAGYYFEELYSQKYFDTFQVEYIVDNDEKKWGEMRHSFSIKSPKELLHEKEKFVVIICCRNSEEIVRQLEKMKIKNYYCYLP